MIMKKFWIIEKYISIAEFLKLMRSYSHPLPQKVKSLYERVRINPNNYTIFYSEVRQMLNSDDYIPREGISLGPVMYLGFEGKTARVIDFTDTDDKRHTILTNKTFILMKR